MTKDTVPQDYTLGLAIFDAVPVILFGLASWLLWKMTGSVVLLIGGAICFAAGMLKVPLISSYFMILDQDYSQYKLAKRLI